MANKWIPVAELRAMRLLERGFIMRRNAETEEYWWETGGECTLQGRALRNKGLITVESSSEDAPVPEHVRITPEGKNALYSSRHRELKG
ncbi:hypothetical protein ACR9GP_25290 [Enterobacter ludwigii]